jgi:geranylgeranyl reductase family protein
MGADRVWDVVVVGAGPAGARSAHAARTAGADVLLVERQTLPRYKLCGGGLLQVSLDSLPPDASPDVLAEVRHVSFTHRGRRMRHRYAGAPVMRMIYRRDFDDHLVEVARRAGVEVRTGCAVREIATEEDGVTLSTSDGELRCRALVGADGSAGRTGRFVGARFEQIDLGLEVELRLPARLRRRWADRVHLDWGAVPGSYGWAFPKGEQLTVGVILPRERGADGKAYLAALVEQLGLAGCEQLSSGGHLTRCRADGSPLAAGRVLLAGDAAGLLEPWTREGISFALRSGRLAGTAAARIAAGTAPEAATGDYRRAVEASLGAEMRAGRRCLRAFERRPALFHLVLSATPPGWLAFRRLATGRTTFPRLLRRRTVRAALALAAVSRWPASPAASATT